MRRHGMPIGRGRETLPKSRAARESGVITTAGGVGKADWRGAYGEAERLPMECATSAILPTITDLTGNTRVLSSRDTD
jgi:hypothetical protein